MDNVYFKKLPSNVIPSVSGDDVVIVETNGGKLYWVDSGGAKQLISVDERFEVGDHMIQFYGERTPAQKYGGTWSIDTDYTGRMLVFSGTGFTIGATGGSADAVTVEHQHIGLYINAVSSARRIAINQGNETTGTGYLTPVGDSSYNSNNFVTAYAGESGAGKNMPPYLVCTMWKRIV